MGNARIGIDSKKLTRPPTAHCGGHRETSSGPMDQHSPNNCGSADDFKRTVKFIEDVSLNV
jgi:hypothetical protein